MTEQKQEQPASFLLGHVAPVLSLDNRNWMLASGSEDKTCRIWDLRTEKVHKALTGFESSVTTSTFTTADDHTIYVGSGRQIYTYDLRMDAMILNTTQATKVYDGAEDEINQIALNHRATCLASCDDAGDVRVLDLKTGRWMRSFERRHDNIAMTVQFVPKKDLQALSGGMDKQIVAWDFYKGRATQTIQTDTPVPEASNQTFNPPFVYSISAHPSGTKAAVGLGDGTVQFLHLPSDLPTPPPSASDPAVAAAPVSSSKKSKKKAASSGGGGDGWMIGGRLIDAHSSPIATIEYAGFNPGWLITSSASGTIAIWDDHAARYESMLQQGRQEKQKTDHKELQKQYVLQQMQREKKLASSSSSSSFSRKDPELALPGPLELEHGRALEPIKEFRTSQVFERINCISTSKESEDRLLFVAGTYPRVGEKKMQGRIAIYRL